MNNKEVPVLLLTGYLGSGKTTLLNKILANKKGIKFAVIVNDIGEVNIDAALIEKGGVVGQKDDSLVSLQNGCICCTLKMDLVEQLKEIVDMKRFDYIVIEASGICEPAPIAQTICSIPSLGPQYIKNGILRLDSIVTVVDALRMKDEFANGSDLMKPNLDEEDLASLVIQQMEFCNIILLNKAAEVEPKELEHLKQIIRAIQPKAEIFECNYGDVDLDLIVNTHKFDWQTVATSAGWIQEIESERNGEEEHDEDDDEHEHHHHDEDDDEHEHHHHDEEHEHHHHEDHEHDHHHHHTIIMTMTTKVARLRNMVSEPSYIIAARHSTWLSSMSLLQENGLVTLFVPRVFAILLMNQICAMFSSRLVSRRQSSRLVSGSQQCQPTSSQNCARTIRSSRRNGMRNLVTV